MRPTSIRQKEVLVLIFCGYEIDEHIAVKLLYWDTQSEFDAFMRRLEARRLVRTERGYFWRLTDQGKEAAKVAVPAVREKWKDRDGLRYTLDALPRVQQMENEERNP